MIPEYYTQIPGRCKHSLPHSQLVPRILFSTSIRYHNFSVEQRGGDKFHDYVVLFMHVNGDILYRVLYSCSRLAGWS